jgi:hypothetical protein
MKGKDRAYWLADKIPAYGDYAREAALVLQQQADEIERMRALIADIKAWDVAQYITMPHELRARIQAELVHSVELTGEPNAELSGLSGDSREGRA